MEKNAISKGGVSPLIATVLIIGFTVILAVLIINWGTDFFKTVQEDTSETTEIQFVCVNDLRFDISSAKCLTDPVTGVKGLEVNVNNNGGIRIEDIFMRYESKSGESSDTFVRQEQKVEPFKSYLMVVDNIGTDIGGIKPDEPAFIEMFVSVNVGGVIHGCDAVVQTFGNRNGEPFEGC